MLFRSRPDILRDTEASEMLHNVLEKTKLQTQVPSIPALVEDPVRRIYKRILAVSFIFTCCLYVLIDLSFQVGIIIKGSVYFGSDVSEATHHLDHFRFNHQ